MGLPIYIWVIQAHRGQHQAIGDYASYTTDSLGAANCGVVWTGTVSNVKEYVKNYKTGMPIPRKILFQYKDIFVSMHVD